jgi:hypothetical protein
MAAFADGKLPAPDVVELQRHLLGCEECYAWFSSVAQTLHGDDASPAETGQSRVIRPGLSRWKRSTFPLVVGATAATLAALVLGSAWLIGPLPPPRETDLGSSASPAPPRTVDAVPDPTSLLEHGSVVRALSALAWSDHPSAHAFAPSTSVPGVSLLLGVYRLDLDLALRSGDGDGAEEVVGRILGLLPEQPEVRDLTEPYRALQAYIVSGRPLREAMRPPAIAGTLMEAHLDPALVELGSWLEATRLAALRGDTHFLDMDEPRVQLERARGSKLPPAAARQLDEALVFLGERRWSAARLRQLERSLAEVIRRA